MKRRSLRFGRVWYFIPIIVVSAVVSSCQPADSDALQAVRVRGTLRWGGDEEGGGPYIFRAANDPTQLTGFEVDLMSHLARGLNVTADFRKCQWDDLLKFLGNRQCDVVVNGYELIPERLRTAIATIPYFVYELHLFRRSDDPRLADWNSLTMPRPGGGKWRVGVLTSTAADNYVTRTFGETVSVARYNGTVDAFRDVVTKNLDATVTDTPAAEFFRPTFPVDEIGPPRERGYYVMYLRPGQSALRDALNEGLRGAMRDGTLQAIYQKYGLWTAAQEQLTDPKIEALSETLRPVDAGMGGWAIARRDLPLLLKAAGMTVFLSIVSMPIAVALGLLTALGRLYGPALVRWPLSLYVEVMRGTPLLLQLLFLHYGLIPLVGLPDAFRGYAAIVSAITGLALNYGAYEAEIYRAGLLAIPVGQTEAALALGLSRKQAIWHVVVPQAIRLVIPPVTNDFINLFKDTAVCSVIAVEELSKRYNISVNNTPRAFLELALVTAALYMLMSYPLSVLTRRLERKSTTARA